MLFALLLNILVYLLRHDTHDETEALCQIVFHLLIVALFSIRERILCIKTFYPAPTQPVWAGDFLVHLDFQKPYCTVVVIFEIDFLIVFVSLLQTLTHDRQPLNTILQEHASLLLFVLLPSQQLLPIFLQIFDISFHRFPEGLIHSEFIFPHGGDYPLSHFEFSVLEHLLYIAGDLLFLLRSHSSPRQRRRHGHVLHPACSLLGCAQSMCSVIAVGVGRLRSFLHCW